MDLNELIKEKMSEIASSGERCIDELSLLPIIHTCTYRELLHTIEHGKAISPKSKQNQPESHVYFFYGRSAYQPSEIHKVGLSGKYDLLPISIIFDLESISHLRNQVQVMFPFDSGGFEMYKKIIRSDLSKFQILNPSENAIKTYIQIFFSNNAEYLNFKMEAIKPDMFPDYICVHELIELHKSLESSQLSEFDLRAFTVELQFKEVSYKDKKNVVLPSILFTNSKTRAQLMQRLELTDDSIEIYNVYPELPLPHAIYSMYEKTKTYVNKTFI